MIREGTKILVVEDDASIVRLLELELEHRGLSVRTALDGVAGLAEAARFKPDVIVLDIMLPKMDGVGVLRALRGRGEKTPVVMLTARDDTLDKIHSLNHGADDYLTKPFDVEELLARVGAVLRRSGGEEVIRVSDLTINRATREVRRGERGIELTAREYDVLEFMAKNHQRVLSTRAKARKPPAKPPERSWRPNSTAEGRSGRSRPSARTGFCERSSAGRPRLPPMKKREPGRSAPGKRRRRRSNPSPRIASISSHNLRAARDAEVSPNSV